MLKMFVLTMCVGLLVGVSAQEMFENKTNVMTARCRAQCLNKFHIDSPEKNCLDAFQCWSCWTLCQKLYDFNSWRQICDDRRRCSTGCQESCKFYNSHSELIEATRTDTSFREPLRYRYNSADNTVYFRWSKPEGNDQIEPLVYVLVAKEHLTDSWRQIDQTFYLNTTIRRDELTSSSRIRLTAYDSNGKVAEIEKSVSEFVLNKWTPTLKFLKSSSKRLEDVEAVITWPFLSANVARYEVEWKQVDPSVDITGHLDTHNNMAVISLWPRSTYEITVRALSANSIPIIAEGEIVVVDTSLLPRSTDSTQQCYNGVCVSYIQFILLVAALVVSITIVIVVKLLLRRKDSADDELTSYIVPEKNLPYIRSNIQSFVIPNGFKHSLLVDESCYPIPQTPSIIYKV